MSNREAAIQELESSMKRVLDNIYFSEDRLVFVGEDYCVALNKIDVFDGKGAQVPFTDLTQEGALVDIPEELLKAYLRMNNIRVIEQTYVLPFRRVQ